MQTGEITKYVDHRGFGFLRPSNPNDDEVFFHVTNIEGNWQPQVGMHVTYEIDTNPRNGKSQARTVKLLPKAEADKERAWAAAQPVRPTDVRY